MSMGLPINHQVLVADDEADVVNLVTQNLSAAGFLVTRASDGQDALEKARRMEPALVVLDLMMPKMSGTEVLRALKSDPRTATIAVVMLTARKDEVDRIVSLELGADDYVTKPFSPRELTLRVKSILSRRAGPPPVARFNSVGAITIDRDAHEVRALGKRVELTAVEYKLLNALFRHPGRVFSREELLNSVWGMDSEIELRTVDTHLRRLRDKLGTAAEQVQTVRGFGYRLDDSGAQN
jgi:two-component system, OmpR family, phosphate regulon response regulator PhoB